MGIVQAVLFVEENNKIHTIPNQKIKSEEEPEEEIII